MRVARVLYSSNSKSTGATTLRDHLCESGGQAFVELALVLPIFILLLIGAVEVGRLAYASIEVSNAARAGAAYGAQTGTTASDFTNIQLAATQDAPDVTSLSATPSLSCSCESSAGAITTFSSCSNTVTNLTTCPSPSRIIQTLHVTTTAQVNTLFHAVPGIPSTVTLQGQAIMRVQQ
jgi:Flp pilus assembly protein TadG